MILGFTGTRKGMDDRQKAMVRRVLAMYAPEITEFKHGDCIGADAEAHAIAVSLGLADKIRRYPSTIEGTQAHCQDGVIAHPPAPPFVRDAMIVHGCDGLLAAPYNMVQKGGTWHTIGLAKMANKPVLICKRKGQP